MSSGYNTRSKGTICAQPTAESIEDPEEGCERLQKRIDYNKTKRNAKDGTTQQNTGASSNSSGDSLAKNSNSTKKPT